MNHKAIYALSLPRYDEQSSHSATLKTNSFAL